MPVRNKNKTIGVSINSFDSAEDRVVYRWVLKVLVELNGHREFIEGKAYRSRNVAAFLHLDDNLDASKKSTHNNIPAELSRMSREACNEDDVHGAEDIFNQNFDRMADAFGFTQHEVEFLKLCILVESNHILNETMDFLGTLNHVRFVNVCAVILGFSHQQIKKIISAESSLVKSGLLSFDFSSGSNFDNLFRIEISQLTSLVHDQFYQIEDIFKGVISPVGEANTTLKDFSYLNGFASSVLPYLDSILNSKSSVGHNILIYGPPGTGKTEFVKVLANELDTSLYEVAVNPNEALRISSPVNRLKAFQSAQYLLRNKRSLILFDEVEEIFNDGGFFSPSTSDSMQGSINNILENNPVPAIWITNEHRVMDNAFLRRFDRVIEMKIPPYSKRLDIVHHYCDDYIGESTMKRLAATEDLSPAVLERARNVAEIGLKDIDVSSRDQQFVHIINQTLKAQSFKKVPRMERGVDQSYSLDVLNTKMDMRKLSDGLLESQSGRLCFYGPPGTGKTEYVHWLSKQLDKQLLIKKSSDLISCFIGNTEKNLAEAFEEADHDDAILLLDEVDSFLQDRSNAKQSWQVSEVNELLSQMESFSGIFIAATNLVETLDKAALRRFDAKIKFDYLTMKQREEMLVMTCELLNIKPPKPQHLKLLSGLDNLATGDFAALKRKSLFSSIESPEEIISSLIEESELKGGSVRSIGFH